MELPKDETFPAIPGVISSLKSGFDVIANHIAIILLPIFLDLYLWLGPRLKAGDLLQPLIAELDSFNAGGDAMMIDMQRLTETWELFQELNLLSLLRTFPIGITSLINGLLPSRTPIGDPSIIEIASSLELIGWLSGLTVIGWVGGGVYFAWVTALTYREEKRDFAWAKRAVLQSSLLSLLWIVLIVVVGVPGMLVFSLFYIISPVIAQGVLLFLTFFAMWLIVPFFFSAHGIFTKGENAFRSVLSSIKLSRYTLPTSSLFVLGVLILSQGFNFLWSVPSSGSWMLLIGILGHAYVTTALLAASFVYYRDMSAWLEVVLEKMKANASSVQA